jgi:hypothetical protein
MEVKAIEPVRGASSLGFYNRCLIVPKKPVGKRRSILDLSKLNGLYVTGQKFKMDTVEQVRGFVAIWD